MKRSVNVIYALKIGVFENKLKAKMLFLATSFGDINFYVSLH